MYLETFLFYKMFCRSPQFQIKFQTCGGKIFYVVKLEVSSQPSGEANLRFFVLKHLRILSYLNPHYRYVVRYTLKCLVHTMSTIFFSLKIINKYQGPTS